jgi:hypothetical protein
MSPHKLIYDSSFTKQHSFPAAEIDAVVGFFLKNNFDIASANSVAIGILNYARTNNVPPFELLDSLKPLTEVQLTDVILEILNTNRDKTSLLGYRIPHVYDLYETRNIVV